MQAIILAAGMGRRLGPYTDGNTKCMIRVGDKTLIQRMLDALTLHPISRIILVIGYKGENLRKHVGESWKGIPVLYVENEIYDETNNIYSLYLAKELLIEEETILLESDLIFDDEILTRLIQDDRENLVLVSKFQSWMDGTVIRMGKNRRIKEFISGKRLRFKDSAEYFKTVNIYKFSVEFSTNHYLPFLEAYIRSVGHNEYYEQVLSVINFMDNANLQACELQSTHRWYEIDDNQDFEIAKTL
ncbi:MAG: phosphocholine cytidylyltransferase family protein, partial [Spirochaetaceae bacterium]|nr:phosphocholine cytidylyltransferase family protein [Spirochaetaceae bacterium]